MNSGELPFDESNYDDEDSETLEDERPKLSLKAAIAWIGTRDPELIRQIETNDWGEQLNESTFKFASSGSDAWTQLQRHIATGKISATGVPYLVPDEFDLSAGGWSATGGGFEHKISPELFSGLEPVIHPLAPYSTLRPFGVILTGAKWYRDVHIDARELQINFPQKKKRNREARKTDAAARVYGKLFPTPESRGRSQQMDRFDLLNKELKTRQDETVALSVFKNVEKKAKRGLKKLK
jgi:hypothetical protein